MEMKASCWKESEEGVIRMEKMRENEGVEYVVFEVR